MSPAQAQLVAANAAHSLPLQNLAPFESLLTPLAALGSQTSGTSQGTTTQSVPLSQQIIGGAIGGLGLLNGFGLPLPYNAPQTPGYSSQSGSPTNPPPTYNQSPSASAPPSGGIAGMVQSLANGIVGGIDNHPLTLMSLGAGIAQGGIGRGLALATAAAQAERNLQAQKVNHAHVLNALTGAGVPPDEALAAVLNPSLMRVLAVKYLGPRAGGNAAGAAAPAGAAAASPGGAAAGAASYSPNATNGASANTANGWQAQARAPAIPSGSALPAGVGIGSSYSRSRRLWRDGSGNLFDTQGKAVV